MGNVGRFNLNKQLKKYIDLKKGWFNKTFSIKNSKPYCVYI